MTTHKTTALSNDPYLTDKYKECDGKNCKNTAIHHLKIKYINKTGNFCQRCTNDLLRSDLAAEIQERD